jgi:DNA-directed RNA polymerase subunit F
MGAVFRPKDLGRGGFRKVIEHSIRDLHPDTKDDVSRLLNSWEDTISEERLKNMLGFDKAQEILKIINRKKDDQDNLNI